MIYENVPEIIADLPSRAKKGEDFPIFCIVKDSDRFPIAMKQISADIICTGKRYQAQLLMFQLEPMPISERLWYIVKKIQLPHDFVGDITVNIRFEFLCNGRMIQVWTDNLPGLSHKPLKSFISSEPLPSFPGWFCGEAHCHSEKTDDQIEFGAPVEVIGEIAKAMGLKWVAITDHSYDLDVPVGELYGIDSKLERWNSLEMEIKSYNYQNYLNEVLLLRGEEVSCGNSRVQNVHLLVYGMPEFIPGRGDGGKRGKKGLTLNNAPDLSIDRVLEKVSFQNAVAYAAHPKEGASLLNRLFLKRGLWNNEDSIRPGLTGLQIWNGPPKSGFDKSYAHWIQMLLRGHRLFAIAGSDAHGDFNRFRFVKFPFFKLQEDLERTFGTPRTYLRCASLDEANILEALRMGRALITNAPVAIFEVSNNRGDIAQIGDTIAGEASEQFKLKIEAKSTDEFGKLTQIVLYRGDIGSKSEEVELSLYPDEFSYEFYANFEPKQNCYLRLLALSEKDDKEHLCLTNPIWINTEIRG